jgi:hypothetical protein
LELFSLEEKAAQLPGGLFVCAKTLNDKTFERTRKILAEKAVFF